jgi:hypothetical protein
VCRTNRRTQKLFLRTYGVKLNIYESILL